MLISFNFLKSCLCTLQRVRVRFYLYRGTMAELTERLTLGFKENKHLYAFSHVQITPAYLKDAGF